LDEIRARFHETHERQYTFRLDSPVEIVNFHLAAFARVRKPEILSTEKNGGSVDDAYKGVRHCHVPGYGFVEMPVYERVRLPQNQMIKGPAVVEEKTSTTLIMPGDIFYVDRYSNLIIKPLGVA
jgi:N-methylhydantoinase A